MALYAVALAPDAGQVDVGRLLPPAEQLGVLLSLIDTPLLIGLICLFIRAHDERVRDVLLGTRRIATEVRLGLPLIAGALVIAVVSVVALRLTIPSLHNLPVNPLEHLMRIEVRPVRGVEDHLLRVGGTSSPVPGPARRSAGDVRARGTCRKRPQGPLSAGR